jgi:type I restriction enzyme M protein
MQDDCYLIAADGWKAGLTNINKGKKEVILDSDLVPKSLVIDRYFKKEKKAIEELEAKKEIISSQLEELVEEHAADEGYLALDKLSRATVQKRWKEIKDDKKAKEEVAVLETYLKLSEELSEAKKKVDISIFELDKNAIARYKTLTGDDVKSLVVDDKWMATIEQNITSEMERVSQALTQRIKELAERYELPLPVQSKLVDKLENQVSQHLLKMGFSWK